MMRPTRRRWRPHEHRQYSTGQRNPFACSPLRRHGWAWYRANDLGGRHLDVGCNVGTFLDRLAATSGRSCFGVDLELGDVGGSGVVLAVADVSGGLPFMDGSFASVSLLDVLEHVADERAALREIARVVAPGGRLLVTVPAAHAFSWLDPDDVAFRFPRLHRLLWSARYGGARYRHRFVEARRGMVGDIAAVRGRHENYAPDRLEALVREAGFVVDELVGSGLFFRWLQIPALMLPAPLQPLFDRALAWDARRFEGPVTSGVRKANLFLRARRAPTACPWTPPVGGGFPSAG